MLPFGQGFHPWIERNEATLLKARAGRVVVEMRDHLAAGEAPAAPPGCAVAPAGQPPRQCRRAFDVAKYPLGRFASTSRRPLNRELV